MSEDAQAKQTETDEQNPHGGAPSVDDLMAQVKELTAERDKAAAESSKWEKRSKSNFEKAKKYDELAAQTMTDAERIEAEKARADEAEARLTAYEAEMQRAKDVAEVSEKFGIPASLITETDRKAMETQARAIKAFADGQPAAQVFSADGKRPGQAKQTSEQAFHDWFAQIRK